jgi:hypothetical protein
MVMRVRTGREELGLTPDSCNYRYPENFGFAFVSLLHFRRRPEVRTAKVARFPGGDVWRATPRDRQSLLACGADLKQNRSDKG